MVQTRHNRASGPPRKQEVLCGWFKQGIITLADHLEGKKPCVGGLKRKGDVTIRKVIRKKLKELVDVKHKIVYEKEQAAKHSSKSTKDSKLTCKKTKGHYQYYVNAKYISKIEGLKRIKELALEEYRETLLPLLDKQIRYLENVLKTEEQIDAAYMQMYEGKRVLFEPDIVPVKKLKEEFEKETYVGLGFDENDHTEYYTNRGERVRSKSEKIIADELNRLGIPYKYEKPLALNINGKMKDFYPDFTAINTTTGEIKYIEHLGMMDHPNYYQNVLAKLDAYEKNGLLIGRDIVLIHESSYRPLNTKVIADYIDEFLT